MKKTLYLSIATLLLLLTLTLQTIMCIGKAVVFLKNTLVEEFKSTYNIWRITIR